jgi:hypothetical protein
VELSRFRAEDVPRDIRWIDDRHAKPTGWARSPYASVFGTKGARAGARRDLGWIGFPQ